MKINEFHENLKEPVSDPISILRLMKYIYEAEVKQLYCKGLWKSENMLETRFCEHGWHTDEALTYDCVVNAISAYEYRRLNPIDRDWINNLIYWISYLSCNFMPPKYIINKNNGGAQ